MSDTNDTNRGEKSRWNDDRWTNTWPQRETLTDSVTSYLVDTLDAQPGEQIVEIGPGGGRATLEIARRLGPKGSITGVDISRALVDLARERARAAQIQNVSFTVADAQTDSFGAGPFDAACSQFGVMFFDDPLRAFSNIRSQLRRGGRLVFVAWQAAERNVWHIGAAIRPFVPDADRSSTKIGPFALGDPEATLALLRQAGLSSVEHHDVEKTVSAPPSAIYDERQLAVYRVPPEKMADTKKVIEDHLARFRLDDDTYEFPLAFSIWSASNT